MKPDDRSSSNPPETAESILNKGFEAVREAARYHEVRMSKRVRRARGEPPPVDFEEPITGVFEVPPPLARAK